jgi:hypothetical protein
MVDIRRLVVACREMARVHHTSSNCEDIQAKEQEAQAKARKGFYGRLSELRPHMASRT